MYRKSKRSRTLVGKGGRITPNSKKNVQDFVDTINARTDLSKAEKTTLINDLYAKIDAYHLGKKKLTVSGFSSLYEQDRISKIIVASGYSPDELAQEIGVSKKDLLDPNNWNGSIFMGVWELSFNYTSSILRRI